MKKLMVLAAVGAMAFASQAANCNWTISNVFDPSSTATEQVKMNGGAVYLFITAGTGDVGGSFTTVKMDETIAAIAGGDLSVLTKAVKSANLTTAGGISGDTGISTKFGSTSADTLSAFAVIFDAATAATADNYHATALKDQSWSLGASGAKILAFGSQGTSGVTAWTAVAPEPTSGLLLLIGMAGLALRRRRA